MRHAPTYTLFPYTTLFRSHSHPAGAARFHFYFRRWRYHSSRAEAHTSELQSRCDTVCRSLLEKKTEPQACADIRPEAPVTKIVAQHGHDTSGRAESRAYSR